MILGDFLPSPFICFFPHSSFVLTEGLPYDLIGKSERTMELISCCPWPLVATHQVYIGEELSHARPKNTSLKSAHLHTAYWPYWVLMWWPGKNENCRMSQIEDYIISKQKIPIYIRKDNLLFILQSKVIITPLKTVQLGAINSH